MSALQHEPFVFFTTPLLIQAVVAIPFWSLYFGIKYTLRFFERRESRIWWDGNAYHQHEILSWDAGREPLQVWEWIRERKAGRA